MIFSIPTSNLGSRVRLSSQWIRVIAGAVLTLSLLVWALRDMSSALVWSVLQTAQIGWLALSVLSLLASISVRARRWGTLLGTECHPGSFDVRQSAVFIGCAGNYLMPAHAGELMRGLILKKRGSVPLGLGLGSIFVERVLDVVVLMIFILGSFLSERGRVAGTQGLDGVQFAWIGVAFLVVCGGIFATILLSSHIVRLVEGLCHGVGLGRFTPTVVESVKALLNGLAVLRSPKRIGKALVETVLIIGLSVGTFWAAMLAFGITGPGLTGAILTQGITTLGMAVPSVPGYLGTFEAAIRFSLEMYGVTSDVIIAYALALHALIFISLIAAGGVLAIRMGLSWSDLTTASSPIPAQSTEQKAVA